MSDLSLFRVRLSWRSVATIGVIGLLPAACVEAPANPGGGNVPMGASDFVSAPPGGQSDSFNSDRTGTPSAAADAGTSTPAPGAGTSATPRTIEETDLYRLDGDRLYYLNGYRGLMVFDVSNIDAPRLIGRAPLFGSPVEMVVRNGVAYAIVADWYGRDGAGRPFHGSVVRAIDARDPAHITIGSESVLRGWIRDARVVGDVLYTVSEDYGDASPYEDPEAPSASTGPRVVVSSINIADPAHVHSAGERVWAGYSGIFNVSTDAILMAHAATAPDGTWDSSASQVEYVDISDPAGAIRVRGTARIEGQIQGWGANNGRFNIDFDGRYVRALSMQYGGGGHPTYRLTTLDAQHPDTLTSVSALDISSSGWSPAARFDRGRMYLSPEGAYYGPGGTPTGTPVQIYDVTDAAHPHLAGETSVTGNVWNFIPAGDRLFALGNEYSTGPYPYTSSQISLRYLDVTDATAPRVIGTSNFGEGWAWTPAAGDFKAFTMDATRGLVVLPFSGWDNRGGQYSNGLQLIEFSRDMISTSGTAHTRGWTERGIFVHNRLVSLSDLSLSVVDYTDRRTPRLVTEVTLARNIIATQPMGDTLVQVVSDWWGNEDFSTVRVVPISDPDDDLGNPALAEVRIPGVNARVYRNGAMAYVVTTVRSPVTCPTGYGGRPSTDPTPTCYGYSPMVSVVDLSVPRAARLRGTLRLPVPEGYSYGYGWYGDYGWYGWYGWWNGDSMVQVGSDVLAYREYFPRYEYSPDGRTSRRLDRSLLHVIDLANADAPRLASTTVTPSSDNWWGNLHAVGSTLYATHYDYIDRGARFPGVRYFVDRFDLSDRAHPRVLSRVNVPGLMVGASPDQRFLYTVDYRWYDLPDGTGSAARNTFNVLELASGRAYLRSSTDIAGYLGSVFLRGTHAYFSSEVSSYTPGRYVSTVSLHALDLTNPAAPVDRAGSATRGWGWLLGVEGDRAIVQSGWGSGVDVYRLADDRAPELLSFQRTRGWSGYNVSRQGDAMYLASGYWGVQTVNVGH